MIVAAALAIAGCGGSSDDSASTSTAAAAKAPAKVTPTIQIRNSLAGFKGEIDGFDIRPDQTVVVNMAKGAPRSHAANVCAAIVTAHGPSTVAVYDAAGIQLATCP